MECQGKTRMRSLPGPAVRVNSPCIYSEKFRRIEFQGLLRIKIWYDRMKNPAYSYRYADDRAQLSWLARTVLQAYTYSTVGLHVQYCRPTRSVLQAYTYSTVQAYTYSTVGLHVQYCRPTRTVLQADTFSTVVRHVQYCSPTRRKGICSSSCPGITINKESEKLELTLNL